MSNVNNELTFKPKINLNQNTETVIYCRKQK